MAEPIIKINNLSKRYRIGPREKGYKTFSDLIVNGITAPVRNFAKLKNLTKFKKGQEKNVIWALKDVSLELEKGEVLGIIGRNGSGKTTLLKVLSFITNPTEGVAELNGRVSSLLEVGTGFHPEFTGRENIFLNGAILGMGKREIKRKFDEIVAFSGIGKFIDTPVKRYSSGMWVRLAFAIAAYLEPEILLVDEVLAVGDIGFQKKCLGRMEEVAKGGRTVLFVSHNMGAIRSLCKNAIWLDEGRIIKRGSVNEVVGAYEKAQLKHFDKSSYIMERDLKEVKNSFYVSRVEMLDSKSEHTTLFKYNEKITLIVDFAGSFVGDKYNVTFQIYNELGQFIYSGFSAQYHGKYFDPEVKRIRIEIGPLHLPSGKYRIVLGARTEVVESDIWDTAIGFTITECQPFSSNDEMTVFRNGACVVEHSFFEM